MSKYTSFLITFFIIGYAQANEISIGSGVGAPGSRNNIISVSLQNDVPIRGIQLQIADSLQYLVADSAWTLQRSSIFDMAYNTQDQDGFLSIILYSTRAIPPADGEILKIRYRVSEQAVPRTAVRIICKSVVLTDENNKKLTATIVNGIFKITGTTAVNRKTWGPANFELGQNYPNPFNPTTQIPFNLPQNDFTTLTVYNLLGQQIRSLVKNNLKPGQYEIRWDGMDDRGLPVSAGVYLYQLVAGDFKATRQLTLVR